MLGLFSIYDPRQHMLLIKWLGERGAGVDWDQVCKAGGGADRAYYVLMKRLADLPIQAEKTLAAHRLRWMAQKLRLTRL